MKSYRTLFWLAALAPSLVMAQTRETSPEAFQNPPYEFRPMPSLGAGAPNWQLPPTDDLKILFLDRGFGGLLVSPTAPAAPRRPSGGRPRPSFPPNMRPIGLLKDNSPEASPWIPTAPPGEAGIGSYILGIAGISGGPPKPPPANAPGYLSQEYFNQLRQVLDYAKRNGRKIIFYDEVGFPSGIANHTTPEKYYRKVLEKSEEQFAGPGEYQQTLPSDGVLMAVVAMNEATRKRIDLTPMVKNGALDWQAPAGRWKILVFRCVATHAVGGFVDYNISTDYLDPEAVQWFIHLVYEPHALEVGSYFGNTIIMSFFDDVGIYNNDRTWTAKFNERFRERTGRDPAIYYPALWEDIGAETAAARVAFFDTRAEMLADGFPRLVTEWGAAHGLPVSGHCPGNYDIQPVDMNGDPFKFYRAQPVPMVDVIFGRGFGRDGYKLISSEADLDDKPVVAAETFNTTGNSLGYGKMMELYVRGINRFVTGANTTQDIGGPKEFAEWAGRTSLLLQGGRHVADVAILYPIAALEAFYHFDAAGNPTTMPAGTFVPRETDYQAVGEMLMNQAHRDFTFLHPDVLLSKRTRVEGKSLRVENKTDWQSFRALILPGEQVISLPALAKIKEFYDAGGAVIATSLLPSRAAELGTPEEIRVNDLKVQEIMNAMFGPDGRGIFIPRPDAALLARAFEKLGVAPDVAFAGNPQPTAGNGFFSYIHKTKEGKNIYFFANSSSEPVATTAELRGRMKPQMWDPYTGAISQIEGARYVQESGEVYTAFPLKLNAVSATFVVAAGGATP
jgi:alpha-L-rhamnosidase